MCVLCIYKYVHVHVFSMYMFLYMCLLLPTCIHVCNSVPGDLPFLLAKEGLPWGSETPPPPPPNTLSRTLGDWDTKW